MTGGWLDSLVLDNCTLPRSVVPISVSLWPQLQEPYLGCMSSSSYPVSSPSCPTHPHNAAVGADKKGQQVAQVPAIGALGNHARLLQDLSCSQSLFWTYSVDVKLHGLVA